MSANTFPDGCFNYPDNVNPRSKSAPWMQQDSNFEPCRCRSCSRAEALNEDELCQDCFDSMENEIGD